MPKLKWLALISGGLLIACLGIAFFWWQHYKTTPAYSLALLVDAAQRNDAAAFDRMVDMEKVADNFLPQLAQMGTGGLASNFATSLRTQLQSLAPGAVLSLKQIIKEEIRKEINQLAGHSGARPFFLTALAIPFEVNILENDSTAKATMNSEDRQVELFMERRVDGHWKIISLRDDALAARIVSNILKDLPASGSQLDREIRKQLLENLPGALQKLPLSGGR